MFFCFKVGRAAVDRNAVEIASFAGRWAVRNDICLLTFFKKQCKFYLAIRKIKRIVKNTSILCFIKRFSTQN
jgi:hypothetical protein